jgi:murein DD-endopeptidase MepM/ murein hydrolase activator NlpD
MRVRFLRLAGVVFLAACAEERVDAGHAALSDVTITDDVIGIALSLPGQWKTTNDPALFDTYGLVLYRSGAEENGAHEGDEPHAVARIALAYKARPSELEELVRIKMEQYREVDPIRTEVMLGEGKKGIAITGLPGTQPYSVVYTVDRERVYEIGLWTESPGLDDRAMMLLDSIHFQVPTRSVESLGLKTGQEALYAELPADVAAGSARAADRRKALALEAMARGDLPRGRQEFVDPPVATESCGFTAPGSLYWQLQWDGTNTFYSGSWYNYGSSYKGWTAMSGNGGSWWGQGYHVNLCSSAWSSQHYANDWPAQYGANAYAAFSGYVEWAGWGTDGFTTLGRYVVVRNGYYRSLTAHLNSIASGITWGKWIDGYWTVIGYAGSTGGDWAPHLHARVSYGESLTYNGQPYAGESVRPSYLRCFACTDYDVKASSGTGGYYTSYWHGRWMKY